MPNQQRESNEGMDTRTNKNENGHKFVATALKVFPVGIVCTLKNLKC